MAYRRTQRIFPPGRRVWEGRSIVISGLTDWFYAEQAGVGGRIVALRNARGTTGNNMAYSDDGGRSWTTYLSPFGTTTVNPRIIMWHPVGRYWLLAGNAPASMYRSTDGINWTAVSQANMNTTGARNWVYHPQTGRIVGAGFGGTTVVGVWYTTDGITFGTLLNSATSAFASATSVKYMGCNRDTGRIFCWDSLNSSSGTGLRIGYSDDGGATWPGYFTLPAPPSAFTQKFEMAYGNGVLVLSFLGAHYCARSTDNGATWTYHTLTTDTSQAGTWSNLTFKFGRFTIQRNVSGGPALMLQSFDGITWTQVLTSFETTTQNGGVYNGNGLFYVGRQSSRLIFSYF